MKKSSQGAGRSKDGKGFGGSLNPFCPKNRKLIYLFCRKGMCVDPDPVEPTHNRGVGRPRVISTSRLPGEAGDARHTTRNTQHTTRHRLHETQLAPHPTNDTQHTRHSAQKKETLVGFTFRNTTGRRMENCYNDPTEFHPSHTLGWSERDWVSTPGLFF